MKPKDHTRETDFKDTVDLKSNANRAHEKLESRPGEQNELSRYSIQNIGEIK